MLDENSNCPPAVLTNPASPSVVSGKNCLAICQYLLHLETELRLRGLSVTRPKNVCDVLKIAMLRENSAGSNEERIIFDSLSEIAIKSIFNR